MTFSSVYQMFDPLTTVRKQRFWDWFSGDGLKAWWTITANGTDASAMADTVDGGFEVISGSSGGNSSTLNFNNIRQYSHNSSVLITVFGRGSASGGSIAGLNDSLDTWDNASNEAGFFNNSGSTNWSTLTSNGVAQSGTDTGSPIAVDTNFHACKISLEASNVIYSMDGVQEVDKTTNLPTTKMQPNLKSFLVSGASTLKVRYLEAYNT